MGRKRKGAKRTISPEQQAKMQAARTARKAHKEKMRMLKQAEFEGVAGDPIIEELHQADAIRKARLSRRKR